MAILSRVKTWASGETLTAADLNGEFNNIINNLDPDNVEDASANAAAMQATADPYPAASESLATDLRGELQRVRYVLKQVTGEDQWYIDPDTTIAAIAVLIAQATTSARGTAELATGAELVAMSSTTLVNTPSALASLARYGNLWVPACAMTPRATNGAQYGVYEYATNDVNIGYFAFDTSTQEAVHWGMPMPEIWDQSNLKVRYFWSNAAGASASDQVSWGIQCKGISNDDAIDAAYSTSDTCDDTVTADGDLMICTEVSDVVIDGFAAGDMVHWSIFRNVGGNDNMAEDAWLWGVLFQYGIGTAITEWA